MGQGGARARVLEDHAIVREVVEGSVEVPLESRAYENTVQKSL